jgi:hypothetical protein
MFVQGAVVVTRFLSVAVRNARVGVVTCVGFNTETEEELMVYG